MGDGEPFPPPSWPAPGALTLGPARDSSYLMTSGGEAPSLDGISTV
uniref:Uncharacterized protein n=1 Tax=Arundo donax TaxID=35708 RepID=A0A0A8ZVY2_ARUDO